MKHRTSRGVAAMAIGVSLLPTTGCFGGDDGAGDSQAVRAGGSLTIALPADPGNLDPHRSVNGQNLLLNQFAYDTPVKLLNSGEIAPEVVTEWEAGDKSYVLTVRGGVTCADGTPMDAETVAENINYVGNPDNGSPMTGNKVPAGAKATADPAASTVTVKLESEAPFFMENLAELPLVCSKGLADRSTLARATNGSGPYVLEDARSGVSYTYTVREGYTWGPNGASTDVDGIPAKLTFQVVTSATTTANQLLSGQLNVAQASGTDTKRLESAGLFSSGGQLISAELAFNESPGEDVADVEVRRALISALNLDELATIETGGLGKKADGLIASPKICAGNTMDGAVPEYDPEGARAALEGKDVSILLVFSDKDATNSATAQYIAEQWTNVGVDVKLKQQSFEQTSATVFGNGKWSATLIGLGVTNPATLVPFFSGPTPPDGNNFGHFDNPDYERLVASASSKPGTQGCDDWNAAESALFRDADITPISTNPFLYWGKGAKFDVQMNIIHPTSLRVLSE